MGGCLPAPIQLARSHKAGVSRAVPRSPRRDRRRARRPLRIEQRRARGAPASRRHVRYGETGCAVVGRRALGKGKGRGGLPTWRRVGARFVARTRARPARLGRCRRGQQTGQKAAASCRGCGGLPLSVKVRNPRNGGAKCCAPYEEI